MAVPATHVAFDNGMVRRQIEFSLLVQMALETDLRRFAGINDGVGCAAKLNVQTAGTVTGFASDEHRVRARCLQMVMSRGVEAAIGVLMALFARLRTDKSSSGNLRRHHFRPVETAARDHDKAGQHTQQ